MTATNGSDLGARTAPPLRIVDLTPDESQSLRNAFEVHRAVQKHDEPEYSPPSWLFFSGRPRWPFPGTVEALSLAYDQDEPVAFFATSRQEQDNLDVAELQIEVAPEHRRRGIGTEILRRLRREAALAGHTRCLFATPAGGPGEHFLRAAGARCVIADTARRLDLTRVDLARHEALLREARSHASVYEVVSWAGATPPELLDDAAVLHGRMSTDPPLDDLSWEPEVYDAARVRARDEMMTGRGLHGYSTAARERGSGTLVGLTTVTVCADVPEFADQWETIVLPEHRGHRLGLLLKIENLRHTLAHEPAVRAVDTWNADSNRAMLAVNVAMGFTPLREGGEWELAT